MLLAVLPFCLLHCGGNVPSTDFQVAGPCTAACTGRVVRSMDFKDEMADGDEEHRKSCDGPLYAWKSALITNEDSLHVHKTLGVLCLLSFLVRIPFVGERHDMGFASFPEWTLPTLLLHLSLNLSSFQFSIPPRRINSGFRIWPEYRIHSLVFLCRSLVLMFIIWLEKCYDCEPIYSLNLAVVVAAMAAADFGSYYAGEKYKSGFARKLQVPNVAKVLFSFAQFQATTGCLFGMRRFSIQFVFVLIIQCNAFLMTLQRKNLASHSLLVSLYGVMLITGFYVCDSETGLQGGTAKLINAFATTAAFSVRLSPRWPWPLNFVQSKYVVWPVIFLLIQGLRPLIMRADNAVVPLEGLVFATAVSSAASFAVVIYKCLSKNHLDDYLRKKA